MDSASVGSRLLYAIVILFKFLFDGRFAAGVLALREGQPTGPVIDVTPERKPLPEETVKVVEPVKPAEPDHASALHLLAILQREGRFVDFLQEDVSSYTDADIGGAARLVHERCRKALNEYVFLEPLRTEGEGARITVDQGFDPYAIRLTGNVTGDPPFHGALRHHGWRAALVKLPVLPADQDPKILAPAEVEL